MAEPKPPKKVDTDELLRRWEANKKSRIFLQLAEEYRKQDFVDAAVSVLREGLRHHPNFQPAHVALARCFMATGKLAEAQAELQRVHERSPDNLLAGRLLADVLIEQGQRMKALDVLKKLVPFDPDDAELEERIRALESELSPAAAGAPMASEGDTAEFHTSEMSLQAAAAAADEEAAEVDGEEPATLLVDADALADEQEPETLMVEALDLPGPAPAEAIAAAGADVSASPDEDEEEATVLTPALSFGEEDEPETVIVAAETLAEAGGGPSAPAETAEPSSAAEPAVPGPSEGPPEDLLGTPPRPAAAALQDGDDFTSRTLAELYESQGAWDEALAIYEPLASRHPSDAELAKAVTRCRARREGRDLGAELVESVTTAAPVVKAPRWEPVRPSAPPLPETPMRAAAAPTPEPAPLARGPSQEAQRALVAELHRWLRAARAVRQ